MTMTSSEYIDLNGSLSMAHAGVGASLAMATRLGAEVCLAEVREAQATLGKALEKLQALQREERRQRELELAGNAGR